MNCEVWNPCLNALLNWEWCHLYHTVNNSISVEWRKYRTVYPGGVDEVFWGVNCINWLQKTLCLLPVIALICNLSVIACWSELRVKHIFVIAVVNTVEFCTEIERVKLHQKCLLDDWIEISSLYLYNLGTGGLCPTMSVTFRQSHPPHAMIDPLCGQRALSTYLYNTAFHPS